MNSEPLTKEKEKTVSEVEFYNNKGLFDVKIKSRGNMTEVFTAFGFEDVKSAVQGLLEEIDKLPIETIFDKVAETEDNMVIAPFKFIKKRSVIDLIKKWFPDVASEDD